MRGKKPRRPGLVAEVHTESLGFSQLWQGFESTLAATRPEPKTRKPLSSPKTKTRKRIPGTNCTQIVCSRP
eukprot:1858367-Rhodomonas_salina.1